MNITPIVQRILARNREYISFLHEQLLMFKNNKRIADENNDIQSEYEFHENVKFLKKEIKKYIHEQQMLKSLVRGGK